MSWLQRLFNRRIRSVRVVHVAAVLLLSAMILSVYMTKASAGREAASIASINREIAQEERRVRLLRAEIAYLEQPERLERLASQYMALAPVPAQRETAPEGLAEVARRSVEVRP